MPRAIEATPTFEFPVDKHLIITTASGVFSWDRDGIKRLFSSSKKGILAAREARDGSQLLAVADKHVVVLHDCKRGRQESYGLSGGEGHVRLLEYAPDTKSLFLSTSMTGALQQYSISRSRLLDPLSSHPSPPTVLAVSPGSHLLLSASEDPPVTYLQNLVLKTTAIQLHPSASKSAVVAASFHPERHNVFLLAFNDGTLAAYDATKMARRSGVRADGAASLSFNGHAGEISHFEQLHRITNTRDFSDAPDCSLNASVSSRSVGITGAAFLPGYRTRAVSVGADGKCRLVDFEAGGKILRTWHAQAPVTCLSIFSFKKKVDTKPFNVPQKTGPRQKSSTGSTTDTGLFIAVGRVDGQVLLFDSLGLRLDQIVASELGEKILSIEWMKGQSPPVMSDMPISSSARKDQNGLQSPPLPWTGKTTKSHRTAPLELPPTAMFPTSRARPPIDISVLESTDLSTVRHTPAEGIHSPAILPETSYLDLFSPVKKTQPTTKPIQRSPVSPSLPSRPRLSSQTFIRSSSADSTPRKHKHAKGTPKAHTPKHLSLHPLNTKITPRKLSPMRTPPVSARRVVMKPAIRSARKRPLGRVTPKSSDTQPSLAPAARRNGQLLADLRRLGAVPQAQAQGKKKGNTALFAPYMNRTGVSDLPRTKPDSEGKATEERDTKPLAQSVAEAEDTSETHSSDRDIWLSAGSSSGEHDDWHHNRRSYNVKPQPTAAPPQRQPHSPTQPKQSQSLKSTTKKQSPLKATSKTQPPVLSPQPRTSREKKPEVLSMSDEAMFSAVSRISTLDGGVAERDENEKDFAPRSGDVRSLFPRGSSLCSPPPGECGRVGKKGRSKIGNVVSGGNNEQCHGCGELGRKVQDLEVEVKKLRQEVERLKFEKMATREC